MKRITPKKKDKRSEAEKILDERIDIFAENVITIDDANEMLDLMAKRKKLDEKDHPEIPNAVWSGIFSLAGIGMIIHYEKFEALTSKALGFVLKGRV